MERWTFGGILSGLSQELQKGYLENPDNFQRREFFTDINEITNGQLILTKQKYYDFLNFHRNILKNGTIPFIYCDCLSGEDVVMSFITNPSAVEEKGFYRVTIQVRVL